MDAGHRPQSPLVPGNSLPWTVPGSLERSHGALVLASRCQERTKQEAINKLACKQCLVLQALIHMYAKTKTFKMSK